MAESLAGLAGLSFTILTGLIYICVYLWWSNFKLKKEIFIYKNLIKGMMAANSRVTVTMDDEGRISTSYFAAPKQQTKEEMVQKGRDLFGKDEDSEKEWRNSSYDRRFS